MKYLILGDLHCREIWKDIIAKEFDSCDKVIFLGDYTCPREVTLDDPTDACGFLYDVLDFKDKNLDKVILLRGNHDLNLIGYHWAECWPQDHPKVTQYGQTEDVKNWFLKNTQWVYIIPQTNIVCSHAGIGNIFLEECIERCNSANKSILEQISEINRLIPSELFGFTPCRFSDNNGESESQPCTWIRPNTLLHYGVKGITQVVGHTPVKSIINLKDELIKIRENLGVSENKDKVHNYSDVWLCDCLKERQYLIIEDGEFKPYRL